ncbi:two-component sensor histidine kinase [Aphanothece sacrum FPU3]|nr:hypothetical protein [Aphanothece sacrum]GBF86488.1 two-component sensor histidine kinase [Aphanothece sacrum FPU3]
MNEAAEPVIKPTDITLPDGEVITVDGVPYEGWGYEPGKWYVVIQRDDEGNVLWRRRWIIPV